MTHKRIFVICALASCILPMFFVTQSRAVTTKIIHHKSGADLLKGKTENIVIDLRGIIQLGYASQVLVEKLENVWSINSIVISGGIIYIGTSPNGGIYKYSIGQLTKVYPLQSDQKPEKNPTIEDPPSPQDPFRGEEPDAEQDNEPATDSTERCPAEIESTDEINDANEVKPVPSAAEGEERHLSNEHIFAMATDVSGRLLAGISGKECRLCRLEGNKLETIFEPRTTRLKAWTGSDPPLRRTPFGAADDTRYIFAIATDNVGNIYLGTGPKGNVYQLDSLGREAQIIYTSRDKNILSLATAKDGSIYAGSDGRGLVYKINPRTKTATVLYDSEQPEITALLSASTLTSADTYLYAAATSAQAVQAETSFAAESFVAGRPEVPSQKREDSVNPDVSGRKLQIANIKRRAVDESAGKKMPPRQAAKSDKTSVIHKINKEGFVTDVFSETAVFFCLAEQDSKLLVGTGNSAQLFTIDPATEQQAIVYEDEQASQITSIAVADGVVYLGTANPPKLIKLNKTFAADGTYISDLIDAGQPARWGKLQIEADIPQGCKVLIASRSGNVEDVNDPTFSDWTEPIEINEPVQLSCPIGRFCQYKLILKSEDGLKTPIIREIAVASTVPNLAPKVESVNVSRVEPTNKILPGGFKITYKAKDDNSDKLIYKIDLRKIGRTNWIELEDEHEADSFDWDGRTVEDGRYELRVTASDERSNNAATKLTDSRISDPVIIDNTGPVIGENSITKTDSTITLKLLVHDELSIIGEVQYTVDSNAEWKGSIPDDLVYDTTDESFTIVVEDLKAGEHILTVKVKDDVDNTTYKTFDLPGK